jgi:hypothetical protein
MHTAALLIVLFLASASAAFADQPQMLPDSQPSNSTVLRDGAAIDRASLLRPESPDSADSTCLFMRTYVVKREGTGDSTRMVKYYTCQKASKYGVKRAQERSQKKR